MCNFDSLGNAMGFNEKIKTHLKNQDCDRLKDYICAAYDTFNPEKAEDHPCFEPINEAIQFLKTRGWKVATGEWKDTGVQLIVISPNNGWYHSRYDHTSKEV